jgi:aryl-alcohol dehydrogenase-like predicted oxidoreductase
MLTVRLGATGPDVSVQGFGAMRLADPPGPGGDDPSTVILRALDLGVSFLDTAAMYGNGANEELVGRAMQGRRDEVVLATKYGVVPHPGGSWTARGDAATARTSCDQSLRRLRSDVIDVFYLHRRDPRVPIEESVGAMAEIVAEGKVRHLGLSEVTAED